MKFLKNCWYVAGWSADFKRDLLERKIVGQSLLFYRTLEGQPVAIGNTCPHRFVPLALGEQDKPMVEAQQRFLVDRDLMSFGPVLLQPDAAAVRARRMMTELLQRQGEYVPAVL